MQQKKVKALGWLTLISFVKTCWVWTATIHPGLLKVLKAVHSGEENRHPHSHHHPHHHHHHQPHQPHHQKHHKKWISPRACMPGIPGLKAEDPEDGGLWSWRASKLGSWVRRSSEKWLKLLVAVYGRRLLLVLEVGGRGGRGGGVASSGLDGEVRLQLKVSTILELNFFWKKNNLERKAWSWYSLKYQQLSKHRI